MSTNPNDYDPNELRGTSEESEGAFLGAFGTGGTGGSDPLSTESSPGTGQFRELFLLQQSMEEQNLTRPYLASLPQSYAAEMVVFEWLEFLVEKSGFRRTMDVLRYYRSIDWITDEVETRLREYLTSFDDTGTGGQLDRSDHLTSLVYVARLAAMR